MNGWGFALDAIARTKDNFRLRKKSNANDKLGNKNISYVSLMKGTDSKFESLTPKEIEAIKLRYNRRLKVYRRKAILTIVITILLSIPVIYFLLAFLI